MISFRAVIGKTFFEDTTADLKQTIRFIMFICAQILLIIVYPAYQALFTIAVDTHHEVFVILMLPLIKSLIKFLLLRMTTHMEDLTPEAVIFTVDFFNALYLATCMQQATASTTMGVVVAIDFIHVIFSLYSHNRRTSTIQQRLRNLVGGHDNVHLLTLIVLLCHKQDIYAKQVRTTIQLRSSLHYHLSNGTQHLLNMLVEIKSSPSCKQKPRSIHPLSSSILIGVPQRPRCVMEAKDLNRIHPIVPEKQENQARNAVQHHDSVTCNSFILQETLETIFTAECHVLTEYLESIIPILYGGFVLVIVRLPNAIYHIDLQGITRQNATATVHSVFILALLELLSFAVLGVVMQRNCGIRTFHHLAFVLETQMVLIQGKLITWALLTMGFRVIHFGKYFYQTPAKVNFMLTAQIIADSELCIDIIG
ncbi:unnamed protein product [Phytophthora fragariaefolia]|uniref:Unnamed protein product n=1 Tax=Phytophthora fragariaefolia TaxID=1490495 RepID=A0A9W7CMH1_9STRA|nr:unnamed protein product [Phytophthora fragariaefolia]